MGFSRDELQTYRDVAVPDLVGDGVRLLFVGINPGLWTAATQTHFAYPGNRFYPALLAAGIIETLPDLARGMTDAERVAFLDRGIGISNLVNRATARADELSREELRAGGERLVATARRWHPAVVAIVGITAYRLGFDRPRALAGEQPGGIAGARLWVVPNPSGLNAHDTVATLAAAYAEPARAAGLIGADQSGS